MRSIAGGASSAPAPARGFLLAAAGPLLDAWNPLHFTEQSVKAVILLVLVGLGAAIFFGQVITAAVHKYGFTKAAGEAAFAASKEEAALLLNEIRPLAEQARPALDAVNSHEPRLVAVEAELAQVGAKVRQYAAQPAESAVLDRLKALLEAPAPVTVSEAPAPAEPVEVSTGGTP